jgi:glutaredoxin 3
MDTSTAQATVTIYSTPTCHFCQMAKEFFKENGIEYTNHDVSTDAARRAEMLDLSGQMGVPVIVIGNNLIIGFDKRKIAELLGIKEG